MPRARLRCFTRTAFLVALWLGSPCPTWAANDLAGDPLILDTAHATNVVVRGSRYIYAIKYVGPAAATDVAELQVKSSARPFWRAVAGGATEPNLDILRIRTPGDLILPTLTSGKVYIYLGPER